MSTFAFDVSHFLSGTILLLSFAMLYQDRLPPLLNIFIAQSLVLALSITWQAYTQNEPQLLITAGLELCVKVVLIPFVLYTLIRRLKIHRTVETVVGIGPSMIAGMALVGLSMALILREHPAIGGTAREDLAFALSVLLLGLLMMVTRRNAVSQVIGFMAIENSLVLAATGAKGMPFVVETCVAFSALVALIVIGVFLFRIRERFDSVDVSILDHFRGEQP
jgi:hydrogenase-4 component E